jgi:hypothetical protein
MADTTVIETIPCPAFICLARQHSLQAAGGPSITQEGIGVDILIEMNLLHFLSNGSFYWRR